MHFNLRNRKDSPPLSLKGFSRLEHAEGEDIRLAERSSGCLMCIAQLM